MKTLVCSALNFFFFLILFSEAACHSATSGIILCGWRGVILGPKQGLKQKLKSHCTEATRAHFGLCQQAPSQKMPVP